MCKASPTTPAIETYFNYDHYPAIVNDQDRSVGLQDQSVRIRDASIDCFVRRQIKMDSISDQFYNLNNDYSHKSSFFASNNINNSYLSK